MLSIVEGAHRRAMSHAIMHGRSRAPSTTPLRVAVPLPVPGRICLR